MSLGYLPEHAPNALLALDLVWAKIVDTIIRILFAVDVEANNVRVVTAYRPDPDEWTGEMKRRRLV